MRVYRVAVDGQDVTERVLWDRVAYGPEGEGPGRFRWTRPSGLLLVPIDQKGDAPVRLRLRVAAETTKPVELTWTGGSGAARPSPSRSTWRSRSRPGSRWSTCSTTPAAWCSATATGPTGPTRSWTRASTSGPRRCSAFCGSSVCFRTEALRQAGVFDDDFFLYEDTDLSWRLRSLGWRIRYQPAAVARHIHSASSVEWSPLFVFHTDRNRLLMLTKNARAGLAAREVLRYPLTTASLALREVARSRHTRRRPRSARPCCACGSSAPTLRLLPVMLVRRRRIAARASVGRRRLELAGAAVRVGLDATRCWGREPAWALRGRAGRGAGHPGRAGAGGAGPGPVLLAGHPRPAGRGPGRPAGPVRAPPGSRPGCSRPPGPACLAAVEWLSGPVEVFHGTNFVAPPTRRAATVVTVHDLTYLASPRW